MTNLLNQLSGTTRTVYTLKDLFEIGPQYGYTASSDTKKVGPRFLRITDIQGNVVDWGTVPYCQISDEEKTKYLLKKNDLVFARTGATTGMSYFVDTELNEEAVFASYLIRLRFNEKMCDPRLLKYFFQSRNYWGQVNGSLSGSAQPGINAVTLSQMEISLPDLPTQRKIAEILSRYDEKVENNNKIIKNLELSAQAIFDEWFVNFRFPRYEKLLPQDLVSGEVPSGWLQKPLDVIADFLNGIALQKYPVKDGEASLPVIKIREMNSGVDENSERASAVIDPKYIVKSGDVLFSWSGSLELMVWSGENGALNQHIFKVSSATYPKWFFFFWIKHHLQNFRAIASGKATTMGHIQRHHLSESMVNIPSDQILNDADLILRPLFDQTLELKLENTTLKQGRDLLLKKLI